MTNRRQFIKAFAVTAVSAAYVPAQAADERYQSAVNKIWWPKIAH